jgi:DNA-binding transcriptional MerR regulator
VTAAAGERALRIGEVAELVGVTTRTIRYYEERGLLGRSERSKGSHRVYSEADVIRLRELMRLRDLLGLSLEELVELAEAEEARSALRGRWADSTSDAERARIVEAAIPLVERQIALVTSRQETLAAFAHELKGKLASL